MNISELEQTQLVAEGRGRQDELLPVDFGVTEPEAWPGQATTRSSGSFMNRRGNLFKPGKDQPHRTA